MIFSNPVKSIEGTHLKATCEDIKVENSENLDILENDIVNIITDKSLSWFNKTFTLEQIKNKYNKKTFEKGLVIKGILFYKDKFELDTTIEVEQEQNQNQNQDFFDLAKEFFQPVAEPMPEHVSEPIVEPEIVEHASELVAEHVSEPVQIEHIHEEVYEEIGNTEMSNTETKKKSYCTIAKQIKEKLKEAIDNEDLEKALKLSQILAQLNKH